MSAERGPTLVEACRGALDERMADDPRITVLGEDVAQHSGGLELAPPHLGTAMDAAPQVDRRRRGGGREFAQASRSVGHRGPALPGRCRDVTCVECWGLWSRVPGESAAEPPTVPAAEAEAPLRAHR